MIIKSRRYFPNALAEWIASLGLSPMQLIMCLTVFFRSTRLFSRWFNSRRADYLGGITDGNAGGYRPIWFGIFLVLVVEMSQITPPLGFNLFVIQSLTGKNIIYVARAALPFFFMIALAIVLITAYPAIALYLPTLMNS